MNRPVAGRTFFLVALCLTTAIGGTIARAQEPIDVLPADALSHLGQYVRVCGTVTSGAYMAASSRQPTFLNFGQPYPNHEFTVVIWGTDRRKFEAPPLSLFDGRNLCVTGEVAVYKGRPQIIVREPDQIVLAALDPSGGDAARNLSELEAIFIKALLEAYGEDVSYGSGTWDEETVEAMTHFQRAVGAEPTGNPDPQTLRAMAKQTLDLTDEEQERVIRLLLLQLAQRQE